MRLLAVNSFIICVMLLLLASSSLAYESSKLDHFAEAIQLAEKFNDSGMSMAEQQKYPAAMHYFNEAISKDPSCATYYFNLANANWDLAQNEAPLIARNYFLSALKSYNEAIVRAPKFPEAWYNKANVLGKIAQYSEAESSYLRALRQKSNYIEARINLSMLYLKMGNCNKAHETISRVELTDGSPAQMIELKDKVNFAIEKEEEVRSQHYSALSKVSPPTCAGVLVTYSNFVSAPQAGYLRKVR